MGAVLVGRVAEKKFHPQSALPAGLDQQGQARQQGPVSPGALGTAQRGFSSCRLVPPATSHWAVPKQSAPAPCILPARLIALWALSHPPQAARSHLAAGRNVIIDRTNIDPSQRRDFVHLARQLRAEVGLAASHFLKSSVQGCLLPWVAGPACIPALCVCLYTCTI